MRVKVEKGVLVLKLDTLLVPKRGNLVLGNWFEDQLAQLLLFFDNQAALSHFLTVELTRDPLQSN